MATKKETQRKTTNNTIAELARAHLAINTLETRNSDALDFHDLAVWNIKAALEAAYAAGIAADSTRVERTTDQKIDALKPGATIELSRNDAGTSVIAERTGDGKRVRIVRIHADGERMLGYHVVLDESW
jgi:hypothetical protein